MNNQEFFKGQRDFLLNYKRLYRWYLGTLIAYDYSKNQIKPILEERNKQEKIFEKKEVYFEKEKYGETHLVYNDLGHLYNKYKKGHKDFLDEMVLIRLVSLLEVYLVRMIETCFFYNKNLFLEKGKYEINISELLLKNKETLEQEYLNSILDKSGRLGFVEIEKVYKNKFSINFKEFNTKNYNYKHLKKLHDTRHLIIHKLGRVDEKYISDYGYTAKKIKLTIEEIFVYFELVNEFNIFLEKKFKDKILLS